MEVHWLPKVTEPTGIGAGFDSRVSAYNHFLLELSASQVRPTLGQT